MADYQFESIILAEPVTFQGTIAQALTTPSVSREALAAEAASSTSPLGKTLRDTFARVVNVEAYGARRFPLVTEATGSLNPAPTSADYAANDAAFAAAAAEALAIHGTIYIPTGLYPLNRWIIDGKGTVCLTIEGNGSVLMCNPVFDGGASQGSAFVFIGSSNAGTDGLNFLRQVTIRDLNIQGHHYQIGGGDGTRKRDRIGFVLRGIQELLAERVWMSQFSREGWWFDTVYDSSFYACGAAWCGRASPTGSGGLNFYAMKIASSVEDPVTHMRDNSNGLRLTGFHWGVHPAHPRHGRQYPPRIFSRVQVRARSGGHRGQRV